MTFSNWWWWWWCTCGGSGGGGGDDELPFKLKTPSCCRNLRLEQRGHWSDGLIYKRKTISFIVLLISLLALQRNVICLNNNKYRYHGENNNNPLASIAPSLYYLRDLGIYMLRVVRLEVDEGIREYAETIYLRRECVLERKSNCPRWGM